MHDREAQQEVGGFEASPHCAKRVQKYANVALARSHLDLLILPWPGYSASMVCRAGSRLRVKPIHNADASAALQEIWLAAD